jgi:hypothetical protein
MANFWIETFSGFINFILHGLLTYLIGAVITNEIFIRARKKQVQNRNSLVANSNERTGVVLACNLSVVWVLPIDEGIEAYAIANRLTKFSKTIRMGL